MAKNHPNPPLSPEKYIRTRARTLPLGLCYINGNWKATGMAFIVVTRKHVNDNITFGAYQVDLFCLGVKDAFCNFNISPFELEELIKKKDTDSHGVDKMMIVDYVLVHNIIYGSIEYADELGFHPCKDFKLAQYILEEDDEHIELIDIEFGFKGKPAIFPGKEAMPKNIITQLEKSVGQGNFLIFDPGDEDFEDQEEEDDDDDEVEFDQPDFDQEAENIDFDEVEDEDTRPLLDKQIEEFTEEDFEM